MAGSLTQGSYVHSILVEDATGAPFEVHEFLVRERFFYMIRKRRQFELDTGESAERVDGDTFRVVGTDQTLVRIGCG